MSEPFKTTRRRGSRRDFLMMGGAAALGTAGGLLQTSAQAKTPSLPSAPSINTEKSRPNILFIFTDQERYQRNLPPGLSLTFEVSVLEGGVSKASGPASLFIDWFAARGYGGRAVVGGAGFRGAEWHGAWYVHPAAGFAAGAVAGAAAAGAYYHPACGYYPYPPCY